MAALSFATLAGLPPGVARPAYDPSSVVTGILHLGLGAFHRAHEAVYTDAVAAQASAAYAGTKDVRVKLNIAIVLAKVAENAPQTRLEPAVTMVIIAIPSSTTITIATTMDWAWQPRQLLREH